MISDTQLVYFDNDYQETSEDLNKNTFNNFTSRNDINRNYDSSIEIYGSRHIANDHKSSKIKRQYKRSF